jgi:hypothetical protein
MQDEKTGPSRWNDLEEKSYHKSFFRCCFFSKRKSFMHTAVGSCRMHKLIGSRLFCSPLFLVIKTGSKEQQRRGDLFLRPKQIKGQKILKRGKNHKMDAGKSYRVFLCCIRYSKRKEMSSKNARIFIFTCK